MRIERKIFIWTLALLAIFSRPSWSQESSGEPAAQAAAQNEQQAAPPVETPDQSQVSEISPISVSDQPSFESAHPVAANFVRIGLHVSDGAETNPSGDLQDSTQVSPLTSALGSINLQKVGHRSQTDINCVGGFTLYGNYGAAEGYLQQTEQLEADHSFLWRRGQLTIANSFNYSRGGDFGSSSYGGTSAYNLRFGDGQAGAGSPGATDLSPPIQIPVNQESYLNDYATAHLVEHLTQHSSVSLDSAYSIADYLGDSQNLYNGRRTAVEVGYNYQFTQKDGLGVEYGFQTFQFTQAGVGGIRTNSVQLVYRRRVSARLRLVLGGGPAFSNAVGGQDSANGFRLNSTVHASLQYRMHRSDLSFSYNRLQTAGFGVFAGGNSDIAQISAGRSFSRTVRATLVGGYARVTSIGVISTNTAAEPYSYGFAGIAIRRALSPKLSVFTSYQLNDESSFCGASTTCTASVRQHIALIGVDWNIRSMRLE